MTEQTIPVVNLQDYFEGGERREALTRTLGNAFREFGFAAIEGHGIDQRVFDDAYAAFRAFFALPEETKKRYENLKMSRQRGYTSFGVEKAKDSTIPDLKEFFHVGRKVDSSSPMHGRLPENIWPEEVANLRAATETLYSSLDRVADAMLASVSEYLGLDANYFPDMARDGNTVLRVIHYPVCDGFDTPGAMRAAAHEDINLMTLLPPADESGLEIYTRDGKWMPVRAIPGQIIVDTGDMMSRVTGDQIPATTHRVVNPEGEPTPRYSMPFFVHPHMDATLEVLPSCMDGDTAKYPPINAQDFLMQRLREIGLA